MHAYILVRQDFSKFAKQHKAKPLLFELKKIEDVRKLMRLTTLMQSRKTAIVIENIDGATIEAQNAFLKNLEEPSKNIIFVLTAKNLSNILPTIQSRCLIVQTQKQKINLPYDNQTIEFINSKLDEKLRSVSEIRDRDQAKKLIEQLLIYENQTGNYKNIENYLDALKKIKANGNVLLQLTNLVARMVSHG